MLTLRKPLLCTPQPLCHALLQPLAGRKLPVPCTPEGIFLWFLLSYLFWFPWSSAIRNAACCLVHALTVPRVRTEDGAGIQKSVRDASANHDNNNLKTKKKMALGKIKYTCKRQLGRNERHLSSWIAHISAMNWSPLILLASKRV